MSAINGDKARFHRIRKSRLAARERSRAMRKNLSEAALKPPSEAKKP
jgi:hypothetical protein